MIPRASRFRRDPLAAGAVAALFALLAAGPASAGTTYTSTPLVAPGDGSTLWASALSDAGEIVGQTTNPRTNQQVGFAAGPGGFYREFTDPKGHITEAAAVNARGDIAVNFVGGNSGGQQAEHTVFKPAGGAPVDMFPGRWKDSSGVTGMNAAGVAVGIYVREPRAGELPSAQGFAWSQGHVTWVGSLGGSQTSAYAINEANEIVGRSNLDSSRSPIHHAFKWADGTIADLGAIYAAGDSDAWAINASSWVAGSSEIDAKHHTHATLWRDGAMLDLGTLAGDLRSEAFGVNDAGTLVGYSQNVFESRTRAFVWQDGTMVDLNSLVTDLPPGTVLANAYRINNAGQILVGGSGASGPANFLLQPHPAP